MKLINILFVAGLIGSLTTLSSCNDDDTTTIYIPEARSLNIVNFDLSEPLTQTFHVAVSASDYVTNSGMEVKIGRAHV